ncbi:DUF6470 family protein [Terrilactibacillus laevilacticus]|uniref:DUF6470 family protein n=1 Tax=Terrilactibacillus laevilacticus TaxID=1380157 RepID=UPI00114620A9|nr:DUF6470 family protein [Terrilactibacillus laevilacticus]
MNIGPHLEMHQVYGKIDIQTQNANLDIEQGKAQQSIKQQSAEMKINRQPARLTIDQTEAWNNLGLKSAFTAIQENAQKGKQAVLDGIARRAEQGDELMHIERGGNPIADQARLNSQYHETFDTGHTPPFKAVKIDGVPGSLQIDWQTHKPEISAEVNAPQFTYTPGNVQVTMAQYPSLTIEPVGLLIDQKG